MSLSSLYYITAFITVLQAVNLKKKKPKVMHVIDGHKQKRKVTWQREQVLLCWWELYFKQGVQKMPADAKDLGYALERNKTDSTGAALEGERKNRWSQISNVQGYKGSRVSLKPTRRPHVLWGQHSDVFFLSPQGQVGASFPDIIHQWWS